MKNLIIWTLGIALVFASMVGLAFAATQYISVTGYAFRATRQEATQEATAEARAHLTYECRDGWMSDVHVTAPQCSGEDGGAWGCFVTATATCNTE